MRSAWMLGLGLGVGAGWACGPAAFTCAQDSECLDGAVAGSCISGFCAFPSDDCDSGLEYGAHAGRLSGTCVAEDAESLGSGPGPTDGGSGVQPTTSMETGSADAPSDSSGGPPGGPVEFRDDQFEDEFAAGTFDQTQWADGTLGLSPGVASGTFTSRVFDAGGVAQWQTARWQPVGPYGKPLPDGGAAERGYGADGVDMSGNVLLMHLDGRGVWGDGAEVSDASGAGSHGVVISDGGPVPLIEGVFGTAIDDHAASRISIPTAQAPALAFGESDFTWSLWFRMDDPCEQNHVYMGVDNAEGTDYGPHLWLGCTNDQWDECSGNVSQPRVAGVLRSEHSTPDDGGYYCGVSGVDGDPWHHAVVVKSGHQDAELRLYLDGQLEYQGGGSFAGSIVYPDDPDFTIGAFSRGTYPAVGVFDEAAAWDRALSEDEVVAVYRRGSLLLRVALRTCAEPDCADDPAFAGAMLDPPQALGPGTELPVSGVSPGRYVQYRVQLSRRDAGDPSPRLSAVIIRGVR